MPFKDSSKVYAVTYGRKNSTLGERVTILSFRRDVPLPELRERVERVERKRCWDAEVGVLFSDAKSVLMEVSTVACGASKLSRVIDGRYERLQVSYSIAGNTLDMVDRFMWIEKLKDAKLVPLD
jgi:hypothetical protein